MSLERFRKLAADRLEEIERMRLERDIWKSRAETAPSLAELEQAILGRTATEAARKVADLITESRRSDLCDRCGNPRDARITDLGDGELVVVRVCCETASETELQSGLKAFNALFRKLSNSENRHFTGVCAIRKGEVWFQERSSDWVRFNPDGSYDQLTNSQMSREVAQNAL